MSWVPINNSRAFRLGIDPIPDWAMNMITNNRLILHSDKPINDPFDHDHKTNATIYLSNGDTLLMNHGEYITHSLFE